jgi:hypothetical protein
LRSLHNTIRCVLPLAVVGLVWTALRVNTVVLGANTCVKRVYVDPVGIPKFGAKVLAELDDVFGGIWENIPIARPSPYLVMGTLFQHGYWDSRLYALSLPLGWNSHAYGDVFFSLLPYIGESEIFGQWLRSYFARADVHSHVFGGSGSTIFPSRRNPLEDTGLALSRNIDYESSLHIYQRFPSSISRTLSGIRSFLGGTPNQDSNSSVDKQKHKAPKLNPTFYRLSSLSFFERTMVALSRFFRR